MGSAESEGWHIEPVVCVLRAGSKKAPLEIPSELQRRGRTDVRDGRGELPAPLVPAAARGAPDGALRVSGPPRRGSGPAAGLGRTRTAEARPRKRGRHRPESASVATAGRGGPGRDGRQATPRQVPWGSGASAAPSPCNRAKWLNM